MNIIEFKNVSKRYKVGNQEIEAVKHVSFNIESGEFVVVLGASGAGKSTILNLLGEWIQYLKVKYLLKDRILLTSVKRN